ncbi:g7646 [Coccomyxa viridis]|uniref:G7646 protein n=1 Tax=Coccomyxa viridis TaxID=1274662 RepID=A0ABP1G2W6_9CHLO
MSHQGVDNFSSASHKGRQLGTRRMYVDSAEPQTFQPTAAPRVAVFSAHRYVLDFLEQPVMSNFPDSTFIEAQLDANTALLAAGHAAVCCFVNDDLSKEVVERLAEVGVKFVAMRCAGFDRVDVRSCQQLGIKVARVPTYSPASVAEHAVAMLLCLNRNLHLAHIRMWAGDYTLSGLVGFELRCKTVGVVGTGAIGAAAARIFCGFGAKVIAHDLYESEALKKLGVTYVSKEELLQQADVISLHCPLLPSTYHIIDKASIESMQPGAIIVNVSRGGLVDVDAAMDALESGQLGGLAMDVYEQEGALFFKNWSSVSASERYKSWDKKFQLLKSYPNVLISPHSAFLTKEALENICSTTVANIKEFQEGGKLTYEVLPT